MEYKIIWLIYYSTAFLKEVGIIQKWRSHQILGR